MKSITEIQDRRSLVALINQDLKENGIKVPKDKNKKNSLKLEKAPSNSVFGGHLCNVPKTCVPNCGNVPKFLVSAAQLIENQVDVEGLFRKSGSVTRQKELKEKLDRGELLPPGAHVFDVSSLVKQFYRDLPDPLLTKHLHDTFVKVFQIVDQENRQDLLLKLCLLLPSDHLSTLRYTMQFLAKVARSSTQNKMDVANLAVVLAPNIMHTGNKSEKMNSTDHKLIQIQTAIVEYMINIADQIGCVSKSLCERTEMWFGSTYESEDELEKGDDTLDGSRRSKSCDELDNSSRQAEKKKKKKRRSSSIQGMFAAQLSKWRRKSGNNTSLAEQSINSNMSVTSGDVSDGGFITVDIDTSDPPKVPTIEATPKVMRKRKAVEDVAFSATKKKAILDQMPTMTPLQRPFTPMRAKASGMDSPSINFTKDQGSVMFTATPSEASKTMSCSVKSKRHVSGKSSHTPSIKTPKRRGFRGLIRRLSGGKASPEEPSPMNGILTSPVTANRLADDSTFQSPPMVVIDGKKKKRHAKHPSSPARLIASLKPSATPSHNASQSSMADSSSASASHNAPETNMAAKQSPEPSICTPSHKGTAPSSTGITPIVSSLEISDKELAAKLSRDLRKKSNKMLNTTMMFDNTSDTTFERNSRIDEEDCGSKTRRRARSLDGRNAIKRGKPNTVDSGLPSDRYIPSPVRKAMPTPIRPTEANTSIESMDIEMVQSEAGTCEANDTPSTVIVGKQSENKIEDVYVADDGKVKAIQDHSHETYQQYIDDHLADKASKTKRPVSPSKSMDSIDSGISMSQSCDNLALDRQDSSESIGKPLSSSSACTLPNQRSFLEKESINLKTTSNSSLEISVQQGNTSESDTSVNHCFAPPPSPKPPLKQLTPPIQPKFQDETPPLTQTEIPHRPSLIDLQSAAKVTANVEKFSDEPSNHDISEKHNSPYRFPQATSRTRGNASPIRIPSIFAKQDGEAQRFREMAMNAIRNPKPVSKIRANIPLSTNLVHNKAVRKAVKKVECGNSLRLQEHEQKEMRRRNRLMNSSLASSTGNESFISVTSQESGHTVSNSDFSVNPSDKLISVNESNIEIRHGPLENVPSVDNVDSPKLASDPQNKCSTPNADQENGGQTSTPVQDTNSSSFHSHTPSPQFTPISIKSKSVITPTDNPTDAIKAPLKDHNEIHANPSLELPKLKPQILTDEVALNFMLRTQGGLTPKNPMRRSTMKAQKSYRSPVKPVKRLGGSPSSPRTRKYGSSPVRPKTKRNVKDLSPLPAHMKEDMF
ncbi:unnamed protein product [Owenia fusiformis]|uniref:Uncharacterized protein n=1 Tax=Owenia fusiformis TaxID=6347 RepID=A0A8J1Y5N1_OWEFU|nr:unnamed protein product [Owenia fusiformis]